MLFRSFHLGLLVALEDLESYLAEAPFFERYGRDYPQLRRQFSKKSLTEDEEAAMQKFAGVILTICQAGLEKRGLGEEVYLEPLLSSLEIG